MKKDFDTWNSKKKNIHDKNPRVFFREAEVWFCHLGENIGFEQDGKGTNFVRPILIVEKFNNQIFWGVPLTKTVRDGKYYYIFEYQKGVKSIAILSQIRLLDAKRLNYKSGVVERKHMLELKQKLKRLIT